jgi:glutamate racemase
MKRDSQLAVLDWGIGGLGICRLAKSRIAGLSLVYFSDTGVTPYGRMSRTELVSRLNTVIEFLRSQGVTHLVFGCNAASTVLPFLETGDIKLMGVIETTVRITARLHPAGLALIGGRRTVVSGVYRQAFAQRGITITQRIAQPLSALIENGELASARLSDECRRILKPVRNCSHLLLACTHYPAITPVLKNFVSQDTVIIDPTEALVTEIARWKLAPGGKDRFLTSGDAKKMKSAARAVFGIKIGAPQEVVIR